MGTHKTMSVVRQALHRLRVVLGGAALTLTFFLVLPLMQTISKPPTADLIVQNVDTADVPPPPPPPEEKPEDDPEPDEKPPELAEEAPPLDLAQLELALNPGVGDGGLGGDFAVKLNTVAASNNEDVDALFSIGDLDQEPRVIYQPSPILNPKVREKAPGTVHIIFIVDKTGRVEKPIIQKSSDSVFEGPALTAVKQWKFEPGKRNGQPVRFRMRVPITFPKGR